MKKEATSCCETKMPKCQSTWRHIPVVNIHRCQQFSEFTCKAFLCFLLLMTVSDQNAGQKGRGVAGSGSGSGVV